MQEEYAFDDVLDGVLECLASSAAEDRLEGTGYLCEWVSNAYGEVGAGLGQAVREKGAVPVLAKLWRDRELLVQQRSFMVLGNLCSDTVDRNSGLTKAILLRCRAEHTLLDATHSTDPSVVLLACAALQNLCQDYDWAHAVVACGFLPRLEELVRHEDTAVVRYVAGALQNLLAMLHATERGSQLRYLSALARGVPRCPAHLRSGLSAAPTPASHNVAEVILARAHEAAVDEFLRRRALRVLAVAVRSMPSHLRILRVNRARKAQQEAEAAVVRQWQEAAAVIVQATVRRRLAWRAVEAQKLRKVRKAAEEAAAKKRQEEERREAERREAAARFAREQQEKARREAERRAKEERKREAAAVALQAVTRKRAAEGVLRRRRRAVPQLQAAARRRAARRILAAHQTAAVRVQAAARAVPHRRALERAVAAATVIQIAWRRLLRRRQASKRAAAVTVQAAWRRRRGRHEARRRREQRRRRAAAVRMQATWRRKAVWLRLARRAARIKLRDEQRQAREQAIANLVLSTTVSSRARTDGMREKAETSGAKGLVPRPPAEPTGDAAPSPRRKSLAAQQGAMPEKPKLAGDDGTRFAPAKPGSRVGCVCSSGRSGALPSRAVAHDELSEAGLAMTRFVTTARLGAKRAGSTHLVPESSELRLPRLAAAPAAAAAAAAPTLRRPPGAR